MPNGLLLDHCIEPSGLVNAGIFATALGVDLADLLRVAPTQRHLKDLHVVICLVRPWTRTASDSWIWYCTKRLDRFDGRTPAAMISEDRCAELKDFLEAGQALTDLWPPSIPLHYTSGEVRTAANG
ncbi:hypothetical protein T8T21_14665 [Limimaricola variabilis]|uniref:hypothetical protein n=1 Tax=Limimaricola variabilis TaxID=1492771 RepID=UPI002AC897E4|nr:hypothetical protein [Limimaricola variabilis]WPY94329.1 hypothetical protein T8T21_14665 [Limimaricola variabilis]